MSESIEIQAREIKPRALTLELTKGCNLRCGYCYYADRDDAYDAKTSMTPEVAEESVELLLRDGPSDQPLHLHFFGGEPLLNLPLLRHVVEYADRRCAEEGKRMTYEITTNGTRFTPEAIELLNTHRIHVGVSFDGPQDIQDVARPAGGGKSSWEMASTGSRALIDSRQGTDLEAEVHCTVVITRRSLDLVRICDHMEELGFQRIVLAPATDLEGKNFGLREEDLPEIKQAYDQLCADSEQRLREGRSVSVTWFPILLARLQSGERKTSYCQGGLDYLGVAADGDVSLCYRFYENPDYAMGSVQEGLERQVTEELLSTPMDTRTACSQCWARHFCGGGCHHENLLATGNLGDPNPVTCEILRHSMDSTLAMWAKLGDKRRQPVASPAGVAMENTKTWQATDTPLQTKGAHVREMDRERIVYVPDTHEVVVLNPTAQFIFDLCDGSTTVSGIADALSQRFDAPRELLETDLHRTLSLLLQKGAVQ